MAGLQSLLPKLVTALSGLTIGATPVVTVLDHVVEGEIAASEIPAIMLEILPPSVGLKASATREIAWPIDVIILGSYRTTDIAVSIANLFGLADAVIARLDAQGNFGGLLRRTIEYANPAVSTGGESATAYGLESMGGSVYAGTRVHTICTLTRVGGF